MSVLNPSIALSRLREFFSGVKRRNLYIAAAVFLVVVGAFFALRGGAQPAGEQAQTVRSVTLKSVAALSSESTPLSIVGTVVSRSEATVRAETSGEVVRVYRALGDSVAAGTIVAELEDSSQRAALLQAQGAVDAAEANLAKVQKGTRPEQLAILQSALDGAKSGAVNALLSAYTTVDNAIQGGSDAMFTNPNGPGQRYNITSTDSQLSIKIVNQRIQLAAVIKREGSKSTTLGASEDLAAELTLSETELRSVRDFLDDIIQSLNNAILTGDVTASAVASFKATTVASRASVNTSLSAIASSRQALLTAQKNLEQGANGPQNEDVSSAQASVTQAQGALAAARANLEKSIIRAPISGTINSFSLKQGDYVQQTSPLLTVANNGALEIVAYVTEQDTRDIAVGDKAALEEGVVGTITRIAPALDPVTKKIEVRVGLSGSASSLVNGQSVTVTFERRTSSTVSATGPLTIPISAIKVGASDVSVFTVSADGVLQGHVVTIGTLLGDKVAILTGLTPDMVIVTDARGLRDGQTVQTK
ncbi:efflux RND transporter periplasmic adaptor subunit [Candidatus Kaiserbacteria bacterium]|nr:efflux RND transporter periplasmic adaptor subunit [Candidatus Kaiserbacteria bacterium]